MTKNERAEMTFEMAQDGALDKVVGLLKKFESVGDNATMDDIEGFCFMTISNYMTYGYMNMYKYFKKKMKEDFPEMEDDLIKKKYLQHIKGRFSYWGDPVKFTHQQIIENLKQNL